MHRLPLRPILLVIAWLALLSGGANNVCAERTALSFDEIQTEALRLAELAGGTDQVLLVFDIDNTLLAMNQDLGSDQWFNWQQTLGQDDPRCVGDFNELLRIQSLLYALGSMRATEPIRQPQIVSEMQDDGFTILLLTSRGYNVRDSTRRELIANDYDFRKTCLAPRQGFGGPYFPYKPSSVTESGITTEEAHRLLADSRNPGQIQQPRRVSYNEGVYMVAGQHKGLMLRMLFRKAGIDNQFRHIVFVDDNAENTQDFRDAFVDQPVNVVTFRYAREDANVRRFAENQHNAHQSAAEALAKMKRSWQTSNVSQWNLPYSPTEAETPVLQVQ